MPRAPSQKVSDRVIGEYLSEFYKSWGIGVTCFNPKNPQHASALTRECSLSSGETLKTVFTHKFTKAPRGSYGRFVAYIKKETEGAGGEAVAAGTVIGLMAFNAYNPDIYHVVPKDDSAPEGACEPFPQVYDGDIRSISGRTNTKNECTHSPEGNLWEPIIGGHIPAQVVGFNPSHTDAANIARWNRVMDLLVVTAPGYASVAAALIVMGVKRITEYSTARHPIDTILLQTSGEGAANTCLDDGAIEEVARALKFTDTFVLYRPGDNKDAQPLAAMPDRVSLMALRASRECGDKRRFVDARDVLVMLLDRVGSANRDSTQGRCLADLATRGASSAFPQQYNADNAFFRQRALTGDNRGLSGAPLREASACSTDCAPSRDASDADDCDEDECAPKKVKCTPKKGKEKACSLGGYGGYDYGSAAGSYYYGEAAGAEECDDASSTDDGYDSSAYRDY